MEHHWGERGHAECTLHDERPADGHQYACPNCVGCYTPAPDSGVPRDSEACNGARARERPA